jgi:hypothetical protein
MNETKFISDRCVGKARNTFRVMNDTVAGLISDETAKW